MDSVQTLVVRCANIALLGLWLGSAFAGDEITERAVPNLPQMRPTPALPGALNGSAGSTAGTSGSAAGGIGVASDRTAGGAGNSSGGAAAGAAAGTASGSATGGIGNASGGAAGRAPGGAALGGAAGAQVSIDQQLAIMQQRIKTLETQIAALQSVLIVTQAGATLQAPTLLLQSLSGTTIRSGKNLAIDAGESITTRSGTSTLIRASSTALVEGAGTLDLKGAPIRLNGGTKPLATVGSQVQLTGQPIGQVVTGSPAILGN